MNLIYGFILFTAVLAMKGSNAWAGLKFIAVLLQKTTESSEKLVEVAAPELQDLMYRLLSIPELDFCNQNLAICDLTII